MMFVKAIILNLVDLVHMAAQMEEYKLARKASKKFSPNL